jgi:TatD DNase family protein
MQLIDTHTHLYLRQFDHDRAAMLGRARAVGVSRFYLPAIDSETHEAMLKMEADFPNECVAMMGVHPCSVNVDWEKEVNLAANWLQKRPFAAVGEIGLDFYWDKTFTAQQYEAFHAQIELALQYKLPIVIHTRNAMEETIDVVKSYVPRGLKGIFHCFSSHANHARQIVDMGFLLGIGGVVTYKNSGLAEAIAGIPLQHIVLETDAPYLTPVPFRGKRNESSYLQYVVAKLAEVYGRSSEEISAATSANALMVFPAQNIP